MVFKATFKNISVIIITVEGKDMDVSEHERLSSITLRYKLR